MKIEYRHGDLMKAPETVIIQGCNAQGVMGSGVAKLLRDADEEIFTKYRAVYDTQGLVVGDVVFVPSKPLGKLVINAITQEFYGREPDTVYVSYEGLAEAFIKINDHAKTFDIFGGEPPRFALPLIGAGLAQGKWSIISEIIEQLSTNFVPVVYLMDGIIPDGVEGDVLVD